MNYFPSVLKNILFGIFCVSSFISCSTQQLQSVDFTAENDFTNGIEGPAVDVDGNLYAVNFKEQGTIGKVDAGGKGEVFVKLAGERIGNGIEVSADGEKLYVNESVQRMIWQYDIQSDGSIANKSKFTNFDAIWNGRYAMRR